MAPKRTTRARPAPETTTTTTSVTNAQLQAMIDQGVTAALAARDATRNGDDSHTSGTGVRRTERVARECTYQDFMKCQPLYFKGTEGVVELTQWFERMETVFRISNCSVDNQIKFSTCTLLAGALTWWNSHVRIVGQDVAVQSRFRKNSMLCVSMFPEESDRLKVCRVDFADMIREVLWMKPKNRGDTEMASMMDKKSTLSLKGGENKGSLKILPKQSKPTQTRKKRQNMAELTAGSDSSVLVGFLGLMPNNTLWPSESVLSCLLKEQLLEPALNLIVRCCGREFRVLNGYDQKSFDEERGLN
ncbi:hypothetical protein Tco_0573980 [Tanacetum coccineum]